MNMENARPNGVPGGTGSMSWERRMTRRSRKSIQGGRGITRRMAIITNKNATNSNYVNHYHENIKVNNTSDSTYVNRRHENIKSNFARKEAPKVATFDSIPSVLLKTLSNKCLCDVEIVGKDEVPVEAPSFLLAAHSKAFEDVIFARSSGAAAKATGGNAGPRRVELTFAGYDALRAAVHFLATHSLPQGLEIDANETNVRSLCQIYLFGRLFKILALATHADGAARRMMNKAPGLACAAFDECILSTELLPLADRPSLPQDELRLYALGYMRDSPVATLASGGTMFLHPQSITAIVRDQDMDVDEQTMFHILNKWVKQHDDNVEIGRSLVPSIRLSYVKTDYLNNVVRKCGFVESADVEAALRDIEEALASRKPDEEEHVLVEGAGNDDINGIYARLDEDIGLGDDDVVYVKEAQDDGGCVDYGMYLLRSSWAITSCVDSSNLLYSCDVTEDAAPARCRPPRSGWAARSGNDPPPTCTWSPGKDSTIAMGKRYVAPNLAEVGAAGKTIVDLTNGDHGEGQHERSLNTMLCLPIDEGYKDSDYH